LNGGALTRRARADDEQIVSFHKPRNVPQSLG
jgi:hypothetical protein